MNEIIVHPKLAVSEKIKIQEFDQLNCEAADFLLFFDYMIAPRCFKPFATVSKKNFISEIHVLATLKKLNLYAEVNERKFEYQGGAVTNSYNMDSIMIQGLKNKCESNGRKYYKDLHEKETNSPPEPAGEGQTPPPPNSDKEFFSGDSKGTGNVDDNKKTNSTFGKDSVQQGNDTQLNSPAVNNQTMENS